MRVDLLSEASLWMETRPEPQLFWSGFQLCVLCEMSVLDAGSQQKQSDGDQRRGVRAEG